MPVNKYETLGKKHFRSFVKYCTYWIEALGIGDWEVRYCFVEADDDEDPRACMMTSDWNNRLAIIQLYDKWDIRPDPHNLMKTAFHEVCELLLVDVHLMALNRSDFNSYRYDREHHRVIRRLEMLVDKLHAGTINIRKDTDVHGPKVHKKNR